MGKIRGTHSSPGIYTKFTDISYAAKSIGITTLGLVGETEKGPAFEPIAISNWGEYTQYFGGTNPEKFRGSQYLKYELPYIAKEYLSVSDQLYVCRVLGLSGYNAGPTFVITANNGKTGKDKKTYAIAVLRSRGTYNTYPKMLDKCNPSGDYDTLHFYCNKIELSEYTSTSMTLNGCDVSPEVEGVGFNVNINDFGRFVIKCYFCEEGKDEILIGSYPVSLNPGDKDYIYNVLGSTANDGNCSSVFVEDLYDIMLETGIIDGEIKTIDQNVTTISPININPVCEPVSDFVTVPCSEESTLKRMVGRTFLCKYKGIPDTTGNTGNGFLYHELNEDGKTYSDKETEMNVGNVYVVIRNVCYDDKGDTDGTKKYFYAEYQDENNEAITVGQIDVDGGDEWKERNVDAVKVLKYNRYYYKKGANLVDQMEDMSDYKEDFRCAITPWIVSEVKGNGANLEVKKLFRFYTITDGNSSNDIVKISIANISPDDGTFDVLVRDFYDTDANPRVLEQFKNVTLKKGKNFIGLKIGTLNGDYELKSKYVMVELMDNSVIETCVPCGFLGYPVRNFGNNIETPNFKYNTIYDDEIRPNKQYFGLSDITGVDVDMLTYKGKNAYTERYYEGYTQPFHLDSRISKEVLESVTICGTPARITIDGDETTTGITWQTVSQNNVTDDGIGPMIGTEYDMEGTIYEDKKLRKFTVYPCGGFDGWDIYRTSRTNTDEFKANRYKGLILNGYGKTFSTLTNPETLALSGKCINSDYYAYLAGINQFENPEKYLINIFATPGIDYVNNKLLCTDAISMIEDVRGDSIYVMTTPDKPFGSSDSVDDMYTAEDVIGNLEDSEIDTYYACTYYPGVKYFDKENSIYVNIPVTKDVVRNMADVDNKLYPWWAPAGTERGNVRCTKARIFSKLEQEDTLYSGRVNAVKTFSKDGVKIWGNKTMYTGDTPMNRINVVRLMLYMRKLINESCRHLIFDQNDATLKAEFEDIVKPILEQIQKDRGITSFRLDISQTPEEMDAHELSCTLWVKPTPTLEYIEINFMVTPQGVDFDM